MKRKAERVDRHRLAQAYVKCHAKCRTSANLGPFAGCRCQCGGLGHGSETLGGMTPRARRAAEAQMRLDLARGSVMVDSRLTIGREIKVFEQLVLEEISKVKKKLAG